MFDSNLIIKDEDLKTQELPLKVSDLVALLKNDVEKKHGNVKVIGEISSFKRWRSGHCYFDVKDDKALIPAVMFSGFFDKVSFDVSDGLEAIISGKISIYAPQSRLQMMVYAIEPIGQGALALQFLKLKEALAKKGLFDDLYKKTIKKFNLRIGIVTSTHGAALRDMLKIIKNRNPKVCVVIAQARVQGQGAKEEIAKGITLLDTYARCDVIIVSRGGGSLEDLWAFNEEIVAQSIFNAKTPIISAVGHETDVTISDLVADVRAATPTHGAQMATADLKEINRDLFEHLSKISFLLRSKIAKYSWELEIKRRLLKDPKMLIFKHGQTLDEALLKLTHLTRKVLRLNSQKLMLKKNLLLKNSPLRKFKERQEALWLAKEKLFKFTPQKKLDLFLAKILDQKKYLNFLIKKRMENVQLQVASMQSKLESLSSLNVLMRGFSIVQTQDNKKVINSLKDIKEGQNLHVHLSDGFIEVLVIRSNKYE